MFAEFLELMGGKMKGVDREEEITAAFKIFDPEGSGVISVESLLNSMTALSEEFTEEQVILPYKGEVCTNFFSR